MMRIMRWRRIGGGEKDTLQLKKTVVLAFFRSLRI